jgi:hypothetical protein
VPEYTCRIPSTRSQADAFDYMARFEHTAEWDPSVISATALTPGDPAVGSEYDVTLQFGNGEQTLRYRIVEMEPPRRVVLLANTGRFDSHDVITVEPDGEGSVVGYDAEIRLKGLWRLAGPIVQGKFRVAGDAAAGGMRRALNPDGGS